MGRVYRKVLGSVSGKVGDVIMRRRNGEQFAYAIPLNFTPSKSEKAVEGRNNFKLAVLLAKTVTADPVLKAIWKNAKIKGTVPYNRVIMYNRPLCSGGSLTLKNIITPPGGSLPISVVAVDKSGLTVTLEKKPPFENIFFLHSYFYLTNPVEAVKDGPVLPALRLKFYPLQVPVYLSPK